VLESVLDHLPGLCNFHCPLCLANYANEVDIVQVDTVKVQEALSRLQQGRQNNNGAVIQTKGTKRQNKNTVPEVDAATADNSGDELEH